jgi:alpha-glucosidase
VLDGYSERVLIGEIYLPTERLVAYYGKDLKGAQLPFNFQLIQTAWNAPAIERLIQQYEAALPAGGWPNWVLGNHDQPRIAARVGARQARIAAMLLLTLRGTPTLYYGDEIGLARVEIPPDRVQDPWEKNEPGLGFGRDPQRTPMQWDASRQAGFSVNEPWLPLSPDHESVNVAALTADPTSILTLYRRLLDLRRKTPALAIGDYAHVGSRDGVLVYSRRHAGQEVMILLNLTSNPVSWTLPDQAAGTVLLSTGLGRDGTPGGRNQSVGPVVSLAADEGLILARAQT